MDGKPVPDGETGEIVVHTENGAPCGLFLGYYNDEESGQVVAFGGKLNVRPAYQREFVYDEKKKVAVMSGSTIGEIKNILELFLLNYGIKPEFRVGGYNRYFEELMFDDGSLKEFGPDFIYIHTSNKNLENLPVPQDPADEVNAKLEKEFAKYVGAKYGIATNSGTSALHVALLAAGIGEGDEVITTPFTFAATGNSILYTGARPVFVDIDPETFTIDPAKIEEAITDKTKAIMPVQLYGQSADMDAIMKIAKEHDLIVIEDAAQAHGAEYKGEMVGNLGDMACFSFYPTKNMTTSEGGMITTNSEEFAENAKVYRAHGSATKYHHDVLGYNFRMTDIAAAIGLEQLKKIDSFNEKRIANFILQFL